MSKIQEIKAAQLGARKAKDAERASLLTTLIGESEIVGKNAGNRESTDEEVIKVIKRFEKNIVDTITISETKKVPQQTYAQYIHELSIIREFLPEKISDAIVQQDIATVMLNEALAYEQKSLGVITKELRAKYGDQFDGQQISTQFKQMMRV